ncbi:MAG: FAD-dependent monooxygenase [Streptosporangiales bacterium]|nr:FAD-dependent monooxygenase [Streptosporangiales bacterium]
MLEDVSSHAQVEAARTDPIRVLIVGADVAGLTLAQLLRRAGLHPVLVERGDEGTDAGYMLALLPLATPVIDDLGLLDEFRAHTIEFDRYVIRTHRGATNKEYSMSGLLSRYGEYRGISRGELMRLFATVGGTVTYRTTATAIEQPEHGPARVTLTTEGTSLTAEFDLVVVADGLHSTTRKLAVPHAELDEVDTGWGGWVVWTPPFPDATTLGEEVWGAGAFVGSYPVAGQNGVIVAGPNDRTRSGPAEFVARLRRELRHVDGRLDAILTAVAAADDPYYWYLTDCRTSSWRGRRVVLLGDAAVGFLPTAGIGACMAIESAWVLSRRLGTASATKVPSTLAAFEAAQRPRVEAAQQNSRQLANLMFNSSRTVAVLRDVATRLVPLQVALRPIRTLLETAPSV